MIKHMIAVAHIDNGARSNAACTRDEFSADLFCGSHACMHGINEKLFQRPVDNFY